MRYSRISKTLGVAAVAALNVDTADIGKLRHRIPFS